MTKIKKHILIVAVLCVVFAGMVYLMMLLDTNSIIDDFTAVVNGDARQSVDYGELIRYDGKRYSVNYCRAYFKINRSFVIHNFKEGYMNVKYTIQYFDDKGEEIYGVGAWDIPTKWYIKKIDGRWKVVNIEEAP